MTKVSKKYFTKFGYDFFGPFLLNFSKWLQLELKNNNINKVFFLSRDGYILKKSFDIIKNNDVKTNYMYASRRSIIVPSIWKNSDLESILKLVNLPRKFTLGDFIRKIGLEDYNLSDELKSINLSKNDIIYNDNKLNCNDIIVKFYNNFKELIISNSKKEYKNLIKYINKINFSGKVAIVDIGWYGSMQKALSNLFADVDIHGYYIGIENNTCDNNFHGFLFNSNKNDCLKQKVYSFRLIFEFLTLAPHGSVKKFINSNQIVEYYSFEYDSNILDILNHIQSSAINYIKHNKNNINDEFNFKKFSKRFLKPKNKDAIYFGNIPYYDNDIIYMAKPKILFYYIFFPKKLINDFTKCGWKIGFMKRLFKIPFPYQKINLFLRKKYSIKEE